VPRNLQNSVNSVERY